MSEEKNLDFVIAILKKYAWKAFPYEICKELIRALPEDNQQLFDEVQVILLNTGVVCGGLVVAYESKKQEITKWLQDDDQKIQKFAKSFINDLENLIASERRRSAM